MKSKKKLLLMGVGVMGALAMGVGATSTFAWYTAEAAVQVTSTSSGYGVQTTSSSVSIDAVGVTFTFAKKADTADVQLLHKAASSGTTASDVAYSAGDILYAGMANGMTLRDYVWDGNNTGARLIGEYQVTASWTGGVAPTGARLEALKGKNYTFVVQKAGNVEILTAAKDSLTLTGTLTDGQKTANLAAAKAYCTGADASTTAHVTIRFENNFAGALGTNSSVTLDKPYYIVKTNNPDGLEYVKEAGVGSTLSTNKIIEATGDQASGTKGYVGSAPYEVKNSVGGGTWNSLDPQVYLHDGDAIGCVAASVDGVAN